MRTAYTSSRYLSQNGYGKTKFSSSGRVLTRRYGTFKIFDLESSLSQNSYGEQRSCSA
jgi:hypothetical protein